MFSSQEKIVALPGDDLLLVNIPGIYTNIGSLFYIWN